MRRCVLLLTLSTVSLHGCGDNSDGDPSSSATIGGGGSGGSATMSVGAAGGGGAGGALPCIGLTADCDGNSGNGCEVSLDADSNNCGACGKSCYGGTCQNGSCMPATVMTGDEDLFDTSDCIDDDIAVYWASSSSNSKVLKKRLDDDIVTLALGTLNANAIDVDNESVYWSELSSMRAVSKNGGSVWQIANVPPDGGIVDAIAVDKDHVYWTTIKLGGDGLGSVIRAPKDGSGAAVVLDTATPPGYHDYLGAVADQAAFYWYDTGGSQAGNAASLKRIPTAGVQSPQVVLQAPSSLAMEQCLAGDADALYWASATSGLMAIMRVNKSGGPATLLGAVPGDNCAGLSVDETHVYVATNISTSTGRVSRMEKKPSGDIKLLAEEDSYIRCVTARSSVAYWITYSDTSKNGSLRLVVK